MSATETKKKTAAKKRAKRKRNLVIVESPAKAKALKKFLGSNYKIEASMGHVRDLPKSTLGVDTENDYEPKYITIRGKGDLLAKLRREAKNANKIFLATDPDREGESISWHLMHSLRLTDEDVLRITFNEITETAVKEAIKNPRELDYDLIDAQQARRLLDRIVGYKISPLLWKKVKKGLSAGRVQSVSLRIICDREAEIEDFVPEEYWSIKAHLDHKTQPFIADFYGIGDKKMSLSSGEAVDEVLSAIKGKPFVVEHVKKGNRKRNPQPPFITSSLQQEAGSRLGFSTAKTMQIAQQLYEGVEIEGRGLEGLVTYIRTDSFAVSDTAYEMAKTYITDTFGKEYLPGKRNIYKARKRAEEAHESIRPTAILRPKDIKSFFKGSV